MKDEKGHGSDAHGGGIETQVPRIFKTLAGNIVVGTKDPSTMTNGQLAKEYENTTMHASAVGREFINAGRGMEKPSDMPAGDPLTQKYQAINSRAGALHDEAEYRNRMGGRRVQSEDGRVKFVGKQPGSLKMGFYP